MKVEFVHALVAALHLDFVSTKTVWVVDAPCLELLEEFEALPPLAVSVPGVGGTPTTIAELVARLRAARALGDEFLIERKDYPSQTAVRWAVYDEREFVVAATYPGGFHGGRPLMGARRHARPLEPRPAEPRGSKEPNAPREARSRRERRAQGYFSGFGRRSINRHAHAKQAGLDSCLMDAEVRSCPEVSSLLLGREARAGGWTVRELIKLALSQTLAAEGRSRLLTEELADANNRLRYPRYGYGYPPPVGPTRLEDPYAPRYSDPYAPRELLSEPKRARYGTYSEGGAPVNRDPYANSSRPSYAPAPAASAAAATPRVLRNPYEDLDAPVEGRQATSKYGYP